MAAAEGAVSTANPAYSRGEIEQAFLQAREQGEAEIVFHPPARDPYHRIADDDEASGPGDLVFLEGGLSGDDNDQSILRADYRALYATIQRASMAHMRTVVNLRATLQDLKQALRATRPTFLIWSGHGGENGFAYDAASAPIPQDVFRSMSKSIYHYVHATCYGTLALQNYKFPLARDHVKVWQGTTNAEQLEDYLRQVDLMEGRAEPLASHGFTCAKQQGRAYEVMAPNGANVKTTGYMKAEFCAISLYGMNEGFICAGTSSGVDIISLATGSSVKGVNWGRRIEDLYECNSKIQMAKEGKVCRRLSPKGDEFGLVQAQNGEPVDGVRFKSLEKCTGFLHHTTGL